MVFIRLNKCNKLPAKWYSCLRTRHQSWRAGFDPVGSYQRREKRRLRLVQACACNLCARESFTRGMGRPQKFFRGVNVDILSILRSVLWQCNANKCSQNAQPFLLHKK